MLAENAVILFLNVYVVNSVAPEGTVVFSVVAFVFRLKLNGAEFTTLGMKAPFYFLNILSHK